MPRLYKGLMFHGIRRYSGAEETHLHIFGSQGKAEVWKRNFTPWGMMERRKRNFSFLAVMAQRKCESGTSNIWQLKQVSGEAELQIFGSKDTEKKFGSGTSHLWNSRQRCNAGVDLHIFGTPGRTSAEAELEIF